MKVQVNAEHSARMGTCTDFENEPGMEESGRMETENKEWNEGMNQAWLDQCERWKVESTARMEKQEKAHKKIRGLGVNERMCGVH